MTPDQADKNLKEKRNRLEERWSALRTERASWKAHWQELSKFIMPRSGRYFVSGRNKGGNRHNSIYDNTGTRSLKILGAGMMAGATSPARPWFKLETPDPDLNRYKPVKMYLDTITDLMMAIFARSNVYRALHQTYEELGLFGTHASFILPDYKNVVHAYTLTAGEYCLATDYQGNVNTLYREFEKTVIETIREFGKDNVSRTVRDLYNDGNLESPVKIVHSLEPRAARDPKMLDSQNMPYESVYWEYGCDDEDRFLRISGFNSFKAVAPRWATSGGDVYGNSPGMEALGDIKQLQHQQLRKGQAIDYQTDPPLQVPTGMKNRDVDRLPGGVTYTDAAGAQQGISSMFNVNLQLDHLLIDMQDVRQRINGAFYADLFLMLANATDTRMTATEVAERHEEKLLMLGPVLERLHNELLEPLVNITFETMVESEILPDPPEELEGVDLNVVFVSMLAQAQRAIGVSSMDRFMGGVTNMVQFDPGVMDKVDVDVWVDEYADNLGVDPGIVIDTEEANDVRKARAQMQAKQAEADALQQQAQTAKDLASAPTDEDNALTELARS